MTAKRDDNLPACDPAFVPGTRWLHVWLEPGFGLTDACVLFQYELVDVQVSSIPWISVPFTAARGLLDSLATIPGTVITPVSVSVPIEA